MTPDSVIVSSPFEELISTDTTPLMIGLIIGLLFAAFFGFRFFRLSIAVSAAMSGYSFGASTLGVLVEDSISAFDARLVLGCVFAVIFAILAPIFYKAFIYFVGGFFGFAFSLSLIAGIFVGFDMTLLGTVLGIIVGLLLVVPAAKLLYKIFKPYLIFTTSLVGSFGATYLTVALICGSNTERLLGSVGIILAVGAVLFVVALIAQVRMNRGRALNL